MKTLRRLSPLALLGAALFLSACDTLFGSDDEEEPPLAALEIRSVYPADAEFRNMADGETIDLSVTFNRPVSLRELGIYLVPDPVSTGALALTGTGRNVTWFDVLLDRNVACYRWLIDGTTLELPGLVRMFPGTEVPLAEFRGAITSSDTSRVKGLGTVVYAYDKEAAFNPLEPASLLELEPRALTVNTYQDSGKLGEWPYVMTNLRKGDEFLVVAIVDSNHDARYDPLNDWWGYYREDETISPGVVQAGVLDSTVTTVDIRLGPPRAARLSD